MLRPLLSCLWRSTFSARIAALSGVRQLGNTCRVEADGTGVQYEAWGCDYCADPDNHLYGHLDQILDEGGGVVLLRCPLCQSIYQSAEEGSDQFLRMTMEQAEAVLPMRLWRVVPGDAWAARSHRRGWPVPRSTDPSEHRQIRKQALRCDERIRHLRFLG